MKHKKKIRTAITLKKPAVRVDELLKKYHYLVLNAKGITSLCH